MLPLIRQVTCCYASRRILYYKSLSSKVAAVKQGDLTSWQQLKLSFWPKDRPHIRIKVVGVACLIVSSKVANTCVPLVFREIVNFFNIPVDADHASQLVVLGGATAVTWILLYGFLRAASPSLNELKNTVFSKIAQSNIRAISQKTYDHLLHLDLSFHQSRKTGQLSRVIDRGTRGADSILRALVVNIIPTFLELGLVFGVLTYNCGLQYTSICMTTMFAYIGFTIATTIWRTKFRREMNKADNEIGFKAVDSLLNFETIKYFNNEGYEARNFDKLLRRFEKGALKTQSSLAFLNSGQQVIITAGITVSMYLAVQQILSGSLTVGDLVMINILLIQVAQPLNFLGSIYREIEQSKTDMRNLNVLLSQSSEIKDLPSARDAQHIAEGKSNIEFQNVSFGYSPDNLILKDISFTVPTGKTVAIVGGSGSGKSTIVRLLYRFYEPLGGSIKMGGVPLPDLKLRSYRKNIGVVPQDCVLFNDVIHYNIHYGNTEASNDDVIAAAKMADIHDTILSFPKGYDTVVGERGQMLSGGEKQRIALARAILKDAPVLIYDEATSSLDSLTEHNILEALHEVSKSKTSIFIAHRLSTIMHADEILVLSEGKIVERGTHKRLLSNVESLYSEMWMQQMSES